MNAPMPLRRYVTPLVDWARDGPEDRARIRVVMHPAGEFFRWVDGVIAPLYWRGLHHARGMTRPQFIDECRERLFLWAKENVAEMSAPEFADENLRKVLATIARNTRIQLWREVKRARLESMDALLENRWRNTAERGSRLVPKNLQTPSLERNVMEKIALEEKIRAVAALLSRFGRTLRSRKIMRELLATLYRTSRSTGKREKIAAHWIVWRLLRLPKGAHLPPYIREDLRARWPETESGVINARVRCLRAALTNFLLQL